MDDRTDEIIARLREALKGSQYLSHETVLKHLPELVELEQAGVDVDADPILRTILLHLDSCESCMEVYSVMSQDLEALTGEKEVLPQFRGTPPRFFEDTRPWWRKILDRLLGR